MMSGACATAVLWSPVVSIPVRVPGWPPVIVYIMVVVPMDRGPTVVRTVVSITVVWMAMITVVVDVQIIRRPTDGKCRADTPEKPVPEVVAG